MRRALVTLSLVLLAATVFAQRPQDLAKWSAKVSAASPASRTVDVVLHADVKEGWKLYALAQPNASTPSMKIAVADSGFALDTKKIVAAPPRTDPEDDSRYYEGTASITLPIAIGKGVAPGTHPVPIDVTFQLCGNGICLRPYTERVTVNVSIH
jgi:DsbC/DsbD-like thiol-disulfide interchange protein